MRGFSSKVHTAKPKMDRSGRLLTWITWFLLTGREADKVDVQLVKVVIEWLRSVPICRGLKVMVTVIIENSIMGNIVHEIIMKVISIMLRIVTIAILIEIYVVVVIVMITIITEVMLEIIV